MLLGQVRATTICLRCVRRDGATSSRLHRFGGHGRRRRRGWRGRALTLTTLTIARRGQTGTLVTHQLALTILHFFEFLALIGVELDGERLLEATENQARFLNGNLTQLADFVLRTIHQGTDFFLLLIRELKSIRHVP